MDCYICERPMAPDQTLMRDWLRDPIHADCYRRLEQCPDCRHPIHLSQDCGYCPGISNCPTGESVPLD